MSDAGRSGPVAPRGGAAYAPSPAPSRPAGVRAAGAAPAPRTGDTPQAQVSDTHSRLQGAAPSLGPTQPADGSGLAGSGTSQAGASGGHTGPRGAGPSLGSTQPAGGSGSAGNGTSRARVGDTDPRPRGAGPSPRPTLSAGGRAARGGSCPAESGSPQARVGDSDPWPRGGGPGPRPTQPADGSGLAGSGTSQVRVGDTDPRATPEPGTFVPAPHVDVVATTGAGDAFAAGFLSATLRGLPLKTRLRHGHLHAAAALTAPGDLATPPTRDTADRLAAVADDVWGTLRLGPGWTQAGTAPEEVRTP
ncbi:PfkB family carbohydrate kinase [Streptomyces sp. NPDC086033]|uniref:PfkB family carbohydrate kinase n=1 Tax=Streptomyces sp. NPDC086033 TaxID=3365747 RepID=UPI0037D8E4CF